MNKILILAPHTDDGELGCGGSIAKLCDQGAEVYYMVFSICTNSLPKGLAPNTLSLEVKIKSIELQHNGLVRMAKVSFGGITKEASLEMLPDAKIDDYVLVHVGVAISKVNEEEAKKTFKYLEEIGELGELEDVEDYLPEKDEQ